jgi:alkylhydroperoxidase/carboxymuconolactone decarboxylase family protein YurZ
MSKDYAQIANDVVTGVGLLGRGAPDTAKAFGSLSTAATATKALDTKTKELMALAIGIAGSLRRLRCLRSVTHVSGPDTTWVVGAQGLYPL